MWRTKGQGEFYTYLPSPENPGFEANSKLCNVAPNSDCNPSYGASVGRGAFDFKSGQWNTVSQRVRLNDVGQSNGEMELFFNGKSVITVKGLKFRNSDQGRFRGLQGQTFFGGKSLAAIYFMVRASHLVTLQVRNRNLLPQKPRILGSPTSPSPSPRRSERLTTYDSIQQPTFSPYSCDLWRICTHAFITPSLPRPCTSLASHFFKWAIL